MSGSTHLLLSSLTAYYNKHSSHRSTLYDIVQGTSPLSLRVIDWFVTHYAKTKNTLYWINEETGELVESSATGNQHKLRKFYLYLEYRAQLKSYSKIHFDCFRRHERISFVIESSPLKVIETTVGQLNFFRWALHNNVLEYIRRHLPEIEEHMSTYQKRAKEPSVGAGTASVQSPNTVIKAHCSLRFD